VDALSGRVVAITGASSGIGRATAIQLAAAGARVVLSARRADRLDALAKDIRAAGGEATVVPGDVASDADMQALVARTVEAFGRIDVMICNAGIAYYGPLDEATPADMRRVVDVNVMGTLYAAHAALTAMRRQGHGHIIAVSSIVARRGVGGSSLYGATKAAQLGLIESLRAEFVGTNLHASVVFPVRTPTELREAAARDFGQQVTGRGPSQSVEEVARAIVNCVRFPRAEVYPMRTSWFLALLAVIAPALSDRIVQRFNRQRTPLTTSSDGDRRS
jgi:short-subunit dehydrogenase